MKIRPVTCIHVAAYLFSALVLTTSAFSYYRAVLLEEYLGNIDTRVFVSEGRFLVHRVDMNLPFEFVSSTDNLSLRCQLCEPPLISGVFERYQEASVVGTERRFLNGGKKVSGTVC